MWACMFSECVWIKTFFNLINLVLMVVFGLFWSSLFTAWLHCNVTHLAGQSSAFESRRKCLNSFHPATSRGQIVRFPFFIGLTLKWSGLLDNEHLQPHSGVNMAVNT